MSGHNKDDYSHLKVLIVEDNEVNQKVTQAMLQHFGINPGIAENGQVALEMISQDKYDLILMDCQMPELNGFETTIKIRNPDKDDGQRFKTDDKVAIIAMTANAAPDDVKACYAAGMNDFIAKPVELDIIKKILEKWHGSA